MEPGGVFGVWGFCAKLPAVCSRPTKDLVLKVSLFIPCITDQLFPATGMNMARVLERLGVAVSYDPRQTCCGQPAFNAGYHGEAETLA